MITKIRDFTIYRDPDYYTAFPAVTAVGGDRLAVVFRRAPNYANLPGWAGTRHGDPNSQLMLTVSDDGGDNWSAPRLLWAPPFGGSQDGGLFYDGKYLFANSFSWRFVPPTVAAALRETGQDEYLHDYLSCLVPDGSCILRSGDRGETWEGPFRPDPLPGDREVLPGHPLRLHNRGNICRAADGTLLLCGQVLGFRPEFHSSIGLYRSSDEGQSWQFAGVPADDGGVAIFEEPNLCMTNSGKLVALIRCHRSPEGEPYARARLWRTESADGGASWSTPCDLGIHAEPVASYRLPDGRFLLACGYRLEPCGVRARLCDPELTDIAAAPEFIIRDDGGWPDTGYPWIAPLSDSRYLVVYYMNPPAVNGAGGIEASIIEVK